MGVDGYATSEIAGENTYNKIPYIFRGDEEGKGGKRKRKKKVEEREEEKRILRNKKRTLGSDSPLYLLSPVSLRV